ncbi:MAG: heavy metal translocating P-type ATPase [Prevotella sp.]|nr:heavy metal translocating P-type ATPase [Prevotella sp.]
MKQTFPVVGMACSSCQAHVEKTLRALDGVTSATVSLSSRHAVVDYDPALVMPQRMKEALNAIGFDLIIEEKHRVEELERGEYRQLLRQMLVAWVLAALVMALSMGWINVGGRDAANQLSLVLALVSMTVCGRSFYIKAAKQACHRLLSMDTLVALSTTIAFVFSAVNTFWGDGLWGVGTWHTYFDATVMIIAFVLTGRVLEQRARRATAGSLRRLMSLAPKTARLVRDDQINDVPIATITPGDMLEVRAGEKIPVDGAVVQAESFMTADAAYIDESMLTGEPSPVAKRRSDQVLAGTILRQGKLLMRARRTGEQTAVAQMINQVRQAQDSKAPVQRVADRMAAVFVPTVLALAVLTFFLWFLIGGTERLAEAILSAVTVMVVACPCAMGLATPTALMVGIGRAAEKNMLVRDAAALENIRNIDALVIDKTGTLTIPNQQVDFTKADSLPIEVRESLKPHAAEAMKRLRDMGIEVYLMSGDRDEAVAHWAQLTGIVHWQSGVKPDDKEALVRQLQQEGHRVAMVGDGVNDSAAIALADVGIAMAKGADVAIDVAQLTLMGDDLRRLPEAVHLSRHTVSMIHQNLFWAFIYNVLAIPVAAGALRLFGINFQLTPMWASALMACSSLSVVLNSLRLRNMKV